MQTSATGSLLFSGTRILARPLIPVITDAAGAEISSSDV